MKLISLNSKQAQRGFTIVELLIATAVLSTILVMVTVMITSIGNLYYKGITQSQTQDATRSIANYLVQDIQLNKGTPVASAAADNITVSIGGTSYTIQAGCEGTELYSWVLNAPVGDDSSHIKHGVWRTKKASGDACVPTDLRKDLANPTSSDYDKEGTELLGPNMRLTSLNFTPSTVNGSYIGVAVSVAYGDDDLLTLNGYNTTCNSGVGDQFCATDQLSTGALQRIQ